MKNSRIWYGLLMTAAILVCITGMLPFLTSLTIATPAQKYLLQNALESPLETTAMSQARILDGTYYFIKTDQQYNDSEKTLIWEEALKNLQNGNGSMSASSLLRNDDNLAWRINYNGKTYTHNWPDSLSDHAILNVIMAQPVDGKFEIYQADGSGKTSAELWNAHLISTPNSLLINSSDPNSSNKLNEVSFQYQLPPGFEIQFYIGPTLQKNGGLIAQIASSIHTAGWAAPLVLLLLALLVFIFPKRMEFPNIIVQKLVSLKLGVVALIYLAAGFGLYIECDRISHEFASGALSLSLQGFGLWKPLSVLSAWAIYYALWFLFFAAMALLFLYVKYAFVYGISRFVREDTLFGMFMRVIEQHTVSNPRFLTEKKLWVVTWLTVAVYVAAALIAAALCVRSFSREAGFVCLGVFGILSIFLCRTTMQRIQKQYKDLVAATARLETGQGMEMPEEQRNMFSAMYTNLGKIQERYSNALEEGLSSQNMKTQLISNISHDLKTPITGIQSYADLIQQSNDLDQIHQYAKKLESYTGRMSSMIKDLFDVAKADSGQIIMNPIEISLQALCEQMAAEWQQSFEEHDLKINMNFQTPGMVMLDPEKMVRVVDNLMSNICKYAQPGTRVYISENERNGKVELRFRNISREEMDFDPNTITERFVRGTKSRHQPGSGLGLSIVKSFVQLQQGTCQVVVDQDIFIIVLTFNAIARDEKSEESLNESGLQ